MYVMQAGALVWAIMKDEDGEEDICRATDDSYDTVVDGELVQGQCVDAPIPSAPSGSAPASGIAESNRGTAHGHMEG